MQAIHQQKFREQQEVERRQRVEALRAREHDKFSQVEERRRAIETADRERREALLRKNLEREEKITAKRKAQLNQTQFAFGSCTPRMNHGYSVARSDSGTDNVLRGSSTMMMSQSMYSSSNSQQHNRRSSEREMNGKRATSVHGLDQTDADGKKRDFYFKTLLSSARY